MKSISCESPCCFRVDALWFLSVASTICYVSLSILSQRFALDIPNIDRPTLSMLALFGLTFAFYWGGILVAVRLPDTRHLAYGLFLSASIFRIAMLPSIPMHEIDIYRYIWDGAVLAEGVSPYRYPPQEVIEASEEKDLIADPVLERLVARKAKSPALDVCLRRIHYGELPSPYPLVSQVVFAGAAMMTGDELSPYARTLIMKSLLVLFDLATFYLVMKLVGIAGMHIGWSMAYGWCPLLMKEIANGGHLDSIAVFFTTAAIWMLVVTLSKQPSKQLLGISASGVFLALGIGAKLYPVLLLPLFGLLWLRKSSFVSSFIGLLVTCSISCILLYPLFGAKETSNHDKKLIHESNAKDMHDLRTSSQSAPMKPSAGIRAFLSEWEMNDLIFMFVVENLRSYEELAPERNPWFVFIPAEWSSALTRGWAKWNRSTSEFLFTRNMSSSNSDVYSRENLRRASFQMSRVITLGVFALSFAFMWKLTGPETGPRDWCRAAMLFLACFWFTCPTQNPWYWCWVLPLLPFAYFRTWYFVSGLTMLYYLRFYLVAHFPDPPALGTAYDGEYFFYFVVPWVEFLPCVVALLAESGYARLTNGRM